MTPTPPRRRWFQFSIASLLWLTLVVALSIAGIREHRRRVMILEAQEAELEAYAAKLEAQATSLKAKLKAVDSKLETAETYLQKLQLEKMMLQATIDGKNLFGGVTEKVHDEVNIQKHKRKLLDEEAEQP
jgi:hypothetical protein